MVLASGAERAEIAQEPRRTLRRSRRRLEMKLLLITLRRGVDTHWIAKPAMLWLILDTPCWDPAASLALDSSSGHCQLRASRVGARCWPAYKVTIRDSPDFSTFRLLFSRSSCSSTFIPLLARRLGHCLSSHSLPPTSFTGFNPLADCFFFSIITPSVSLPPTVINYLSASILSVSSGQALVQ